MFFKKPTPIQQNMDEALNKALIELAEYSVGDEEYPTILNHVSKLHTLKDNQSKQSVSPDTAAIVAGNLAGILIIVGFEKSHVLASKALSWVLKLR